MAGEDNCPTATTKAKYEGQLTIGSSSNCTLDLTDIPQYSLLILELTSDLANCNGRSNRICDYISFEGEKETIGESGDTLINYFESNKNTAVIQFFSVHDQDYSVTLNYTGKYIVVIVYFFSADRYHKSSVKTGKHAKCLTIRFLIRTVNSRFFVPCIPLGELRSSLEKLL